MIHCSHNELDARSNILGMLRNHAFLRKVKGDKKPLTSSGYVSHIYLRNCIDWFLVPQTPTQYQGELTQQQRLPNELLLHIFSYVQSNRDIINLCRSSKALRSVAELCLYRTIELDFDGVQGHAKRALLLLQAIQSPRFSHIVTTIRVHFRPCHERVDPNDVGGHPKVCTCSIIDRDFGTALQFMQALEVLSFKCFLCMNLTSGRHHYLPDLGTRKLRQFSFECHCTMKHHFDVAGLFIAPWMRSVTALNWLETLWTTIPEQKLNELIKSDEFLPHLDTLHYTGSKAHDKLLAGRKICRLSGDYGNFNLLRCIGSDARRKAITHLSISEYYLAHIIDLNRNTGQFCNLRHVGALSFGVQSVDRETSSMVNAFVSIFWSC